MKKIIQVAPLEGKKVSVVFSDGVSGIFDVAPYIRSDFFNRLQDDNYFKQVRLFFYWYWLARRAGYRAGYD